jgi:hypothetical protein
MGASARSGRPPGHAARAGPPAYRPARPPPPGATTTATCPHGTKARRLPARIIRIRRRCLADLISLTPPDRPSAQAFGARRRILARLTTARRTPWMLIAQTCAHPCASRSNLLKRGGYACASRPRGRCDATTRVTGLGSPARRAWRHARVAGRSSGQPPALYQRLRRLVQLGGPPPALCAAR